MKWFVLNEGDGVEKVTGAVDDNDVGGCIKMLLDLAPFDTELVEVEILDMATLLDAAGE